MGRRCGLRLQIGMPKHRIEFSVPWPLSASVTQDLLRHLFGVSLVTYLGLFLGESLHAQLVTRYFDPNVLLVVTVVFGVLVSPWSEIPSRGEPVGWRDNLWIGALTVLTGGIVWYQIRSLGQVAPVIGAVSGAAFFLLARLLLPERDDITSRQS